MTMVKRIRARGYCGLDIDEEITPRMILSGPNGTGKTARMRIIEWALKGVPGRDGFLPFASSPDPEVEVTFDKLTVVRGAAIRVKDEKVSVKNKQAVLPSAGEKSAADVKSRIEATLRPNLFALSLDDWLDGSGTERRRQLLALLSGQMPGSDKAQAALDERLPDNAIWQRLRESIPTDDDAVTYLARVEAAAKAEAKAGRDKKKNAEAILRESGLDDEVLESREDLQGQLDALEAELETMREGARDAKEIARRVREANETKDRFRSNIDAWWPQAPRDETLKAWLDDAHADNETRLASETAKLAELATAIEKVNDQIQRQSDAITAAVEQARAVLSLIEAMEPEEAEQFGLAELLALDGIVVATDLCPLCNSEVEGDLMGRINRRLERCRAAAKEADDQRTALGVDRLRLTKEQDTRRTQQRELRNERERLANARERLRPVEEGLKAATAAQASAGAPIDEGALARVRREKEAVQGRLTALARSEGRREAMSAARQKEADGALDERLATAIVTAAGPNGLQGAFLKRCVGGLDQRLSESFARTHGFAALRLRLYDERGGPDATLVAYRKDPDQALTYGDEVTYDAMSGGQRAAALAALVSALAWEANDRRSLCLIEAGEIDHDSLARLLEVLAEEQMLETVIVATCDERVPVPTGWTLRSFGAPLGVGT